MATAPDDYTEEETDYWAQRVEDKQAGFVKGHRAGWDRAIEAAATIECPTCGGSGGDGYGNDCLQCYGFGNLDPRWVEAIRALEYAPPEGDE